jgi:regulation of enolase protein 1 (concanavalin A-like superfamily)
MRNGDRNALAVCLGLTLCAFLVGAASAEDEVVFKDDFKDKLAEGWAWVREDPKGWRVTEEGLEIRIQPGNMWGPANNAKNVLVRAVPDPAKEPVEVAVTVSNRPTEQYEQVDLVWYYDDSHMVKIGQEQVDGVLCLVMGREEKDRTRTLAKIPIEALRLEVRFLVAGDQLRGQYRPAGEKDWKDAGECTLPAKGEPKVSLQTYQGPAKVERWAKFNAFRIARTK